MLEQKKLSLESDIAAETDRLLYAQKTKVESEANTLNVEIVRLNKSISELEEQKTALTVSITAENEHLDRLKDETNTLIDQLKSLNSELNAAKGELDTVRASVTKQSEAFTTLRETTSALKEEKASVENDIIDANTRLSDLTAEITSLDATYAAKKVDRQAELDKLEARLEKTRQLIVEAIYEDDKRRGDLATLEGVLQERDRLLRVREAKVEDGEGHILRNSNLMKM
jgi:chromosome segregation ATPase